MKPFTEAELAELRERAAAEALGVTSTYWQDAYMALAMAADRLHAMMRRSGEPNILGDEGDSSAADAL